MITVTPWWAKITGEMRAAIERFEGNPEGAVYYAQNPPSAHFDHRQGYRQNIIDLKLREIEKIGPLPDIRESEYSRPETVRDGLSDMFLMHMYFYMRIVQQFGVPLRMKILEIGGGYGGLARIFKTLHSKIDYTIIDLSESLHFSSAFLSLNGIENVRYVVAGKHRDKLINEHFDLVINTNSFQEMPVESVKEYIRVIEEDFDVGGLYSMNYYKNKHQGPEMEGITTDGVGMGNLPITPGLWDVLFHQYDPPVIKADSICSYEELCLRRVK